MNRESTVAVNMNKFSLHMASSRQHPIPMFSGNIQDDPIQFIRIFDRVSKAMKWDDETKYDKFPNYLTDAAEQWYYGKVERRANGPKT